MGRYSVGLLLICLLVCAAFGADEETEDIRTGRPNKDSGATEVGFFVFVLDVDDIDGAEQNFTVNVFLFMTWKDPRLSMECDYVRPGSYLVGRNDTLGVF